MSSLKSAAVFALAATVASFAGAQAPVAAPSPAPAAAVKTAPAKALDKPLWASLSPAQKVALEPLAVEWDKMEGVRKHKWLEIANRFSSMKPDEQARMHEKMREWVQMTPEQRRLVRENYTRAKRIDATQKSEQWEKYQQLPEEQKQKLAAEAAAARTKKQLTNLPPPAQAGAKTVAPIKRSVPPAAACPAGTMINTAASTPPCVAAPATPPPGSPAAPAPNVK
ncbi:DUF3106 domain-containing protein [Massilia sp. R2A-15]|uniref:DUF3106 domain-containing protein n=1 Tax=Massilia sp. R2A-15 TaxID=3064278 RepID=UPI0027345F8C|nr:DUF3106 domain-containing protein [Massilia sp. R2A-15]WLI87539.1 DUF3106 domain-containing protein [Massilia sp. R2A-15]